MPEGVIVGGWNFVVAAYALVSTGLVLYAVYLITKLRSTRRRVDQERTAFGSAESSARTTGSNAEP